MAQSQHDCNGLILNSQIRPNHQMIRIEARYFACRQAETMNVSYFCQMDFCNEEMEILDRGFHSMTAPSVANRRGVSKDSLNVKRY